MFSKLKENYQLIHIDETTIQCNHEANKKASSNSYMWVMTSGEDEKLNIRQEKSAPILKKFYEWVYLTNQKIYYK